MNDTARSRVQMPDEQTEPALSVMSTDESCLEGIPSGIHGIDERLDGLQAGGVYLVAGTPGPGKLVTVLHFLQAGVEKGERTVMLTTVEEGGIPEIARGWGMDLDRAWEDGSLLLLGFKDDFEMRVLRSTEPLEVLEQLRGLIPEDATRIGVDPGSMFLRSGSRTLLGKAFLDWARKHPATVMATLSVDSAESLPSSTEWLVQSTNAVLQIDRRTDGLHQVRVNRALMGSVGEDDPITLQLTPGRGLVGAEGSPSRRRADRPAGDADRLLIISLDGSTAGDLERWANAAFQTETVHEPLEAVAMLQEGSAFGGILVHSTRKEIRAAVQACRAIRPLTGAAVVFASDDALRSTDRVALLESGADDCLSGGVDFRELEARLRQAVSAGGKPPSVLGLPRGKSGAAAGGRVSPEDFEAEIRRKSRDPALSLFSILGITSSRIPVSELEGVLADTVRSPEGDLVTCTGRRCLVLLQGAREKAAQAFLARFRANLKAVSGEDPGLEVVLRASPLEGEELQRFLASDGVARGGTDDTRA